MGGWYFQNGVFLSTDSVPKCNWGEYPNAGIDLTGATRVTFWARGEKGGEKVEFFVGGIGRNPDTGKAISPYPDSIKRVPRVGTYITLTRKWKKYTINLKGLDLSYIIGGFGWVAKSYLNPNGAIFYIDDII